MCSASPNITCRKATCTLLFRLCWKHSIFLGRRSRPLLQDVGATGWASPGSQLLLSMTVEPSSSSETHPNFCDASSNLVVSSVNYQNTLKHATVSTPMHLSCTRSVCGSFRARWPCPLMKRVSQTLVGAVEKRWYGLPHGSRCGCG